MSLLSRAATVLIRGVWKAIPTVVGIIVISFFTLKLAPGDVVDVLAGESGGGSAETMAALRERTGLDQPVLTQFVNYVTNLVHFDLGTSPRFNRPVFDMIAERLPGTLMLMMSALVVALVLGVALGVLMASFANRLPDRIVSVLVLLFYSIPSFWVGLMMIVLFSVTLGWLPTGGAETIGADLAGFAAVADRLRYMVMPTLSLALFYVALYSRLTRAAMLEVRSLDFVRTAVAKGVRPLRVTTRHVLRNALLPVTTMAGIHVGGLLGGAVVVETVYNWPGLGRLAVDSILSRDLAVILGILLFSSILVVIANIVVDVIQALIDPRIEAS
jgi:peptide/nickel transport system permease protein